MNMNTRSTKRQSGFTLIEILVAVFIISIGFLALSQMEFLSLRQKKMAEEGSDATNLIQFSADRDLAELKRITLLNARTFTIEANGRTADYTYCDGSSDASVCSNCPCNPLSVVASDPTTVGTKDVQCAVIGIDSSDVTSINYTTDQTACLDDYSTILSNLQTEGLFILRRASVESETTDTVTIDSIYTVNLTYAVKSLKQFRDNGFSLALKDNLAVQGISLTAQTDNYSDVVPISSGAWDSVVVAHVP